MTVLWESPCSTEMRSNLMRCPAPVLSEVKGLGEESVEGDCPRLAGGIVKDSGAACRKVEAGESPQAVASNRARIDMRYPHLDGMAGLYWRGIRFVKQGFLQTR